MPIKYMCLECGHKWDATENPSGYRQCPNENCRSTDVVPAGFWRMVEVGRQLGISHKTPFLDVIKSFQAVWSEEGLLRLGVFEFWRVMKRVIKEIENPRYLSRGES